MTRVSPSIDEDVEKDVEEEEEEEVSTVASAKAVDFRRSFKLILEEFDSQTLFVFSSGDPNFVLQFSVLKDGVTEEIAQL